MHSIISVLPDHIANQIAAGEVIQRPASVVKELVENAIDAGSTKIQVYIKDAGKTLIQVIDDGKGMNALDAENCFLRHATSKIHSADDLFALTTKGFRGEALASIAAIAHVTLQTCRTEDETGTKLLIEGSKTISTEEVVCAKGTNFEVRNLFFNVPARRNFLKSNDIEFRHIKDEFERVALAHPDIYFVLNHNDSEIYNLRGVTLRKRIVDVIGDRQNERLVPIDETSEIVKIHGFVVKPEYAKKTRGEQFFFVNNRFFKDTYFNNAVTRAFEGLIQPKSFPGYFLYFEIDPAKIDVNVHPTKTEIKFEEDRFIYSILISSIRQALGKYNIAPTLDFEREQSFDIPYDRYSQPIVEPTIKVDTSYNPFQSNNGSRTSSSSQNKAITNLGFGANTATQQDWDNFYSVEEESNQVEQQQFEMEEEATLEKWDNFLVKLPYIFFTSKNGLMVIHSHRAYERIIYDAMMQEFIIHPIASQTLLFPVEKEIATQEAESWNSNKSLIERLGFLSEVKNNTLYLNAIPAVLEEETLYSCIDSILEKLSIDQLDKGEVAHVLISQIAKNAGKSKRVTNQKEAVMDVVEKLFQCPEHAFTPSGKQIIKTIPLEDIHQIF